MFCENCHTESSIVYTPKSELSVSGRYNERLWRYFPHNHMSALKTEDEAAKFINYLWQSGSKFKKSNVHA
jgi:hypothetical protein